MSFSFYSLPGNVNALEVGTSFLSLCILMNRSNSFVFSFLEDMFFKFWCVKKYHSRQMKRRIDHLQFLGKVKKKAINRTENAKKKILCN